MFFILDISFQCCESKYDNPDDTDKILELPVFTICLFYMLGSMFNKLLSEVLL